VFSFGGGLAGFAQIINIPFIYAILAFFGSFYLFSSVSEKYGHIAWLVIFIPFSIFGIVTE
jgi:hypothetical protein